MKTKTPTLDKMVENKEKSQAIGEALDWLMNEKKVHFMTYVEPYIEYHDKAFEKEVKKAGEDTYAAKVKRLNNPSKWDYAGGWTPFTFTIESLLAEYFGIDLNKADKEKRAILSDIRKKQSV